MKKTFFSILALFIFLCNSYGQSNEPVKENLKFDQANQKALSHDYSAAISLYDEAISLEPKNHLIYYNRGISKLNISDIKGACVDLKKSLELGYVKAKEVITTFCDHGVKTDQNNLH
jgi:tetratricopeptide (TPR) repeat protein